MVREITMRLIKQSGPHCLVTSAAMILDTDPEIIHKEIGGDGTSIVWEPNGMRGIHIQEIQDCCKRRSKMIAPIEMTPYLAPDAEHQPFRVFPEKLELLRFTNHIINHRAILITPNHAVAWDGENVFDPQGFIKSIFEYNVQEAWVLCDLIL